MGNIKLAVTVRTARRTIAAKEPFSATQLVFTVILTYPTLSGKCKNFFFGREGGEEFFFQIFDTSQFDLRNTV